MNNKPRPPTKTCPGCHRELDRATGFGLSRSRYDGIQNYCRECINKRNRDHHKTPRGREVTRAANRRYRAKKKALSRGQTLV